MQRTRNGTYRFQGQYRWWASHAWDYTPKRRRFDRRNSSSESPSVSQKKVAVIYIMCMYMRVYIIYYTSTYTHTHRDNEIEIGDEDGDAKLSWRERLCGKYKYGLGARRWRRGSCIWTNDYVTVGMFPAFSFINLIL